MNTTSRCSKNLRHIPHFSDERFHSAVHEASRHGHVHVIHKQPEESEGDHQEHQELAASLRAVLGCNGAGPQGEAFAGQPPHQACAEVPELQAADTAAYQAHR